MAVSPKSMWSSGQPRRIALSLVLGTVVACVASVPAQAAASLPVSGARDQGVYTPTTVDLSDPDPETTFSTYIGALSNQLLVTGEREVAGGSPIAFQVSPAGQYAGYQADIAVHQIGADGEFLDGGASANVRLLDDELRVDDARVDDTVPSIPDRPLAVW